MTSKETIRANVIACLKAGGVDAGGRGAVSALIKLGFSNGTAQRIMDGSTSIGLDIIDKLAGKFAIEPWRLIARDLGQDEAPTGLSALDGQEGMLVAFFRRLHVGAKRDMLASLERADSLDHQRQQQPQLVPAPMKFAPPSSVSSRLVPSPIKKSAPPATLASRLIDPPFGKKQRARQQQRKAGEKK